MNWLYDEQALRERGEQALAGMANVFQEELDAKRKIDTSTKERSRRWTLKKRLSKTRHLTPFRSRLICVRLTKR